MIMKKVCIVSFLLVTTLLNIYFVKDAINGNIHTALPQTEKRCKINTDLYIPCLRLGGEEDTIIKANRLSYVAILDIVTIWTLASLSLFIKSNENKKTVNN